MRRRLYLECLQKLTHCLKARHFLALALLSLLALPCRSGIVIQVNSSIVDGGELVNNVELLDSTLVYDGVTYVFHLDEYEVEYQGLTGLIGAIMIHSAHFEAVSYNGEKTDVQLLSKVLPPVSSDQPTVQVYKLTNDATQSGMNGTITGNISIKYLDDDPTAKDINTGEQVHTIFPVRYPHQLFQDDSNVQSLGFPDNMVSVPDNFCHGAMSLTSVKLPNTIKTIGEGAFQNSGLQSFESPSSLETIGEYAFYCSSLTTASLNEGLRTIRKSAFSQTNIQKIELPSTLTSIGDYAFWGCLTQVNSNIESPFVIDSNVFDGYDGNATKRMNLVVRVPSGTKSAYRNTDGWKDYRFIFDNDKEGTTFESPTVEGITVMYSIIDEDTKECQVGYPIDSDNASQYQEYIENIDKSILTFTIPESANGYKVTRIGNHCMPSIGQENNINNIILPSTIKEIGALAFVSTAGVTINIPQEVEYIGPSAFASSWGLFVEVENLTPILIDEYTFYSEYGSDSPNYLRVPTGSKSAYASADGWKNFGLENIVEGDLYKSFDVDVDGIIVTFTITGDNTVQVGLINAVSNGTKAINSETEGNLSIPNNVTFKGKSYTVTKIGSRAFSYCNKLTSITMPSTITDIDYCAFEGCGNVFKSSLVLPENLKFIGERAFSYDELASIVIPASVEHIGERAFAECWVTEVNVESEEPITDVAENAFLINTNGRGDWYAQYVADYLATRALRVPIDSKQKYATAPVWKDFANIGEGDELKVFTAKTIEDVEVTYTILDTEEKTAMVGTLAGDLAIDSEIKSAVTIPSEVTYNNVAYKVIKVGAKAFYNCWEESIEIPSTITEIGDKAFQSYYARPQVFISNVIEPIAIDENTFGSLTPQFSTLRVPEGSMEKYAAADYWKDFNAIYEGDEGLTFTALTVEGVELKFMIIDKGQNYVELTSQNPDAEEITIPAKVNYLQKTYTVTRIGKSFSNWDNSLIKVVIPNTVTSIGSWTFYNCHNLKEAHVQNDEPISEISTDVFYGITDYATLYVPVGSKEKYEAADVWNRFKTIVEEDNDDNTDDGTTLTVEVDTEEELTIVTRLSVEVTDEEAHEVTVTAAGIPASEYGSSVAIPAEVTIAGETYAVTAIAANAFEGSTEVTDIYLPDTETPIELGENALKISDTDIATIHTPLALLDDYALNKQLKQNFEADKVMAVVMAPNRYWTFSSGVDVLLPQGISVYKCLLNSEGTEVEITQISDEQLTAGSSRVIKANNGVLVACTNGTGGDAYYIVAHAGNQTSGTTPATTDAKSYGTDNLLEPVIVSKHYAAADYYVLKDNEFHAVEDNDSKVPACKAVLKKPAGVSAARSLTINNGNDGTTGISTIGITDTEDVWYNLQGQRIAKPNTKGIYIKNGKKVTIK